MRPTSPPPLSWRLTTAVLLVVSVASISSCAQFSKDAVDARIAHAELNAQNLDATAGALQADYATINAREEAEKLSALWDFANDTALDTASTPNERRVKFIKEAHARMTEIETARDTRTGYVAAIQNGSKRIRTGNALSQQELELAERIASLTSPTTKEAPKPNANP